MNKEKLLSLIKVTENNEIIKNSKSNFFFLFSAVCFFVLTTNRNELIGMPFAICLLARISTQIHSIHSTIKQSSLWIRIFCFASAFSICLNCQEKLDNNILELVSLKHFDFFWEKANPIFEKLNTGLILPNAFSKVLSYLIAFLSILFVYICLALFWKNIFKIFKKHRIFNDTTKPELIFYAILIAISFVLVIFTFSQSNAFYDCKVQYDVIYTSDSTDLVKGDVYVNLFHPENDLRQPLFAVFAAPFVGITYLLKTLFNAPASIQAMFSNFIQVIVLFIANFLLTKMMKLSHIKRICFISISVCTYSQLLFTLMMEQYIFAYFWLIFCLYLISEKDYSSRIAFWGASGTLLTSAILLPLTSGKSLVKDFKGWFTDIVKHGLEFLFVLLCSCRFNILVNSSEQISGLSQFTGRTISLTDKIYQYITFVENCFFPPAAGIDSTTYDHISWQLKPINTISFVGLAIIVLVFISAILNRKKTSSLLSIGWVAFSFVILVILGWGTKENGLILYSLYFGWAFLVLIFQLIEKIETKLNVKALIPVFSIGCIISLVALNAPAIKELVDFAITNYPV